MAGKSKKGGKMWQDKARKMKWKIMVLMG